MKRAARYTAGPRLVLVCATLALYVGCADATTREGGGRGEALSGPATEGLPDGVFAVTISRGQGYATECYASHVSPETLLLAAWSTWARSTR